MQKPYKPVQIGSADIMLGGFNQINRATKDLQRIRDWRSGERPTILRVHHGHHPARPRRPINSLVKRQYQIEWNNTPITNVLRFVEHDSVPFGSGQGTHSVSPEWKINEYIPQAESTGATYFFFRLSSSEESSMTNPSSSFFARFFFFMRFFNSSSSAGNSLVKVWNVVIMI
jgi:hypothetical protein